MNRSTLARRYLPLAAVIAIQVLIIAVVPSKAPNEQQVAAATGGFGASGTGAGGATGAGGTDVGGAGTTGVGGTGASGVGGSGTAGGGGSGGASAAGSNLPPGVAPKGDTSHCVNGLQYDPKIYAWAPPCYGKYTGTNPGATYRGVTKDTIKVEVMRGNYGQAVNAILVSQHSLASHQQFDDFLHAAADFINKHYELYGRKIQFEQYQIQCGTGGQGRPDNSCLRNEMRTMVGSKNPFAVIWSNPVSSETYDELSQLHVLNLGGYGFTDDFNQAHRPYHWDVQMGGTQLADHVAEWWCKRMWAGGQAKAQFAGTDNAGTTDLSKMSRVLGVLSTDDPENKATVSILKRELGKCGASVVHQYFYSQDITTADAQRRAAVAEMRKSPEATSIMCFCDQVAPVFLYQQERDQAYYPENIIVGTGNMDQDNAAAGNYDHTLAPQTPPNSYPEFENAFGVAQDAQQEPAATGQDSRVWRASGRPGNSPYSFDTDWDYYAMVAMMIQAAGPTLTPQNVEAGVFRLPALRPSNNAGPFTGQRSFAPGDYTWHDNMREVYWSPKTPSHYDGKPGAYLTVAPQQWYNLGQYPNGLLALPPKPR